MNTTIGNAILERAGHRRRLARLTALISYVVEGAAGGAPLAAQPFLDLAERTARSLGELDGAVRQACAAGRLPGGQSPAEALAALGGLRAQRRALASALATGLRRGVAAGASSTLEPALIEARIAELEAAERDLQGELAVYLWTSALLG